jgi:hypothetical protein
MKPFLILLLLASLSFAESLPQTAYFVPNQGQWDGAFDYYCDFGLMQCYVTSSGLTLDLQEPTPLISPRERGENPHSPLLAGGQGGVNSVRKGHVLILNYVNANLHPDIIAEDLLPHYSNYFLSRDSCRWKGHVPNYSKVIQKNVWPGIDIELRASEHGIESVYHIKPGADPSQIVLDYEGLDEQLFVDANGRLHLKTSVSDLTEQSPFAYQIQNRLQSSVPVQFRLLGNNRYGFALGVYDSSQEVVIDPLVYCTPFPESVRHMVTDADSNKIVCGLIWPGQSFPTTPGAYEESHRTHEFISKLTPNCDGFIFSTYLPGSGNNGTVLIHPNRNIVYVGVVGVSWPVTADAFDTSCIGTEDYGIAMLSADGSTLLFSSFLGGSRGELSPCVDFDSLGRIYVGGETTSQDYPVTPDAMFPQRTFASPTACITVIDWHPARIVYSTYFAGNGWSSAYSIHVVAPGLIWLNCGEVRDTLPTTPDALIPTFPVGHINVGYFGLIDLSRNVVRYGSYLGDIANTLFDLIPEDSTHLWLWGRAAQPQFLPMPEGGYNAGPLRDADGFILKLELPNHIEYGTFIGGSGQDGFSSVTIEPSGSVLASGATWSADFPTTPDAFDRHHHSDHVDPDSNDVFLVRFSPHLDSLLYGTYIGGTYDDDPRAMVYEGPDRIWIAGGSFSSDFPYTTMHHFWEGDYWLRSFFMRFSLPPYMSAHAPHSLHPSSFSLSAYPNPFNPSARIEFTLPKAGKVSLKVYDVLGREVAVLVNETLNARDHDVVFNGSELPSGIYFARLEAGGVSQTRKMVLLK